MHLMKVDPRALKENSDRSRQTKSTPQADALLLATIKAVGLVQPPVIAPETDGGNGYIIDSGHRRVKQAIAAGLEEIDVLVIDAANDNGAMRNMVENIAREPLNPVDQWRAIERLVALGWTEEAIGVALALPVRQIRKLRLLANVLPAMLDHMAKGDMPNEQQLRAIAAAKLDEQREVWKAQKPKKGDPQVSWWSVANALSKKRMYARDASFGDDLVQAYGIAWVEDLFAPADEDSRYTTNVEAFLGAQQEWMTINLPKRGVITDVNNWGQVVLPPKAERTYGKPGKGDRTAMYLDREGKVQSVPFRLPKPKKGKGADDSEGVDDTIVMAKPRPDMTRKGVEMIGDLRTDALHEALARAPIEDDTLTALLVLALAGRNISIQSGASDDVYGFARMERHAVQLVDGDGKFAFDRDTLRIAARSALIDVLSARQNRTDSGIVARLAGDAIGADGFLPSMGTEEFLACVSRQALERSCKDTPVLPRARVKDTRAALVEHFREQRFVHPSALFAPDATEVSAWRSKSADVADEDADAAASDAADIRDMHERLIVETAASLQEGLGERAMQIHLQRIVGAYVGSAHGAGQFYSRAVTEARDATAKSACDARDEDVDGPVGFDGPAQRKREFAADMGVQAHALLMAAEGAVTAYEQVIGERWKPFERAAETTGASVDRKAAAAQIAAFG